MILEILFCSPDTIINSDTTRLDMSWVFFSTSSGVFLKKGSRIGQLIFENLDYVDLELVVGSGEQDINVLLVASFD